MVEKERRIADRYELSAVLGEGGMGIVWRARDTRLGRAVAVKVLPAVLIGSGVARTRLIREARAAAALEHSGIIRVYDVGETDDGGAFLVMELIRGHSLRHALEQGSLSLLRRIQVLVEAARALDFAHAAGIVHRDVKPDNIMIRDDGRITIVDFGVAKPITTELLTNAETLPGVTGESLTGVGAIVGTPAYLAPEQARGVNVSPATDQFALAVTAHEALSGRIPWQGQGVVEIVAALLRDEPPRISAVAPVPAELDAVLMRALAKDPRDRFPDMEAFAAALEAGASSLPSDSSVQRPSSPSRVSTPGPLAAAPKADSLQSGDKGPRTAPEANATKLSGATAAPSTITPAPSARHAPSARTIALAALGLGVASLGGWFAYHGRPASMDGSSTTSAAAVAASAAGAGVTACPSFLVTGVDEPWLGGPAAALACERLQISRGGLDARTLVPAELAGAPQEVAKPGFPADLLESPGARDRAIERAKKRGARWLDATLDKQPAAYVVHAVLRAPDGGEIARGDGRGVEIFEAVREALKPLIRASDPPTPEELALMREWLDVSSVEEALDLLDVRTSILIEDPVSLKEACAVIARRQGLSPRVAYLTKVDCARKLRTGRVLEPPPPVDDSSPGAMITTALGQGTEGGPEAVLKRAAELERARDKTTSVEGKARLSAAAAELYNLVGDDRAPTLARVAVTASPKAFDWRMSPWHRIAFASAGDLALGPSLSAWHPWEPIVQSRRAWVDQSATTAFFARAYLLSPRGVYANFYGEKLALEGKMEAARGIAELTNDDVLRVEVLLGEAKFGAVLETVPRLLAALARTEENAAAAFRLAHQGVRAALTLERPAPFVDGMVTGWVASEPHRVIDGVIPFLSLVSACCFAPRATGKRCIGRLEQLRAESKLPTIFKGADTVVAGAARFVVDDYTGAAKAWRTLLRTPGWIQEPLVDVLAVAFDRADAPELGDEVDASRVALVDLPRTADLAWVRSAKRAQRKGDVIRARKLAQAVIEKWRFADEDIPAVREMRELLIKLPR
jgi:eukaryotic-like serine/threonine-protein kinase